MNNLTQYEKNVFLLKCENSLIRYVNLNKSKNETNTCIPRNVFVAGMIGKIFIQKTRRADIAIVILTAGETQVEVTIFSEIYAAYQSLIHEGEIIGVKGRVSLDDWSNNLRISAEELYDAMRDHVKILEYLSENRGEGIQ